MVCGGNVGNSLPSMMTWTFNKKGARSEPAEMGVPFSDHSAISRSNKENKKTLIRALLFVAIFVCFFVFV